MKNILALFIITISLFKTAHGQSSYLINYEIILNTEKPMKKRGQLVFDAQKNRSIFYVTSNLEKNKINKEESFESGNFIELQIGQDSPEFSYFNFKTDTLISAEKVIFDAYNIVEKIPNIDWSITDKTKKINGYNTILATAVFRGRKYQAWFTQKFPLRSGPWKLNGLPGLILEVYDESKRFIWLAKNIVSIENESEYMKYFDFILNDNETIDIKTYAEKRYKNNVNSILRSRLPSDVKLQDVQLTNPRNGMEILFEWEQEIKN